MEKEREMKRERWGTKRERDEERQREEKDEEINTK